MTDPFDLLRADLVRVAAAAPPRRARLSRSRSWLRRRPRGLVLVAAALIISGSAAAAVISLHATGSQRLAGNVPGSPTRPTSASSPVSVRGDQYRIVVFPQLTAGEIGWCTGITYTYHGKPGRYSGFGECGSDYPMRRVPLFGPEVSGGGFSAPSPQIGDTVHFVLTGPGVEYVRVGRTTIAVRQGDPDVPAGDGVAVFFLPAATPPLYVPPAGTGPPYYVTMFVPPHSSREKLPPWLPRKSGLHRVRATPTVALDRLGRVIPNHVSGGYFVSSRWWQRPGRQPDGSCQLARHGLPGLVAHWGHVTDRIRAVSSARGTAFLSCLSTEYYLDGWGMTVAVLLNAQHPGAPVGPMPGTETVIGHPGVVNTRYPTGFGAITARRTGEAWLVAQGGRDLTQRLQVLDALRIHRIQLGGK
jgi:hypothetical protein